MRSGSTCGSVRSRSTARRTATTSATWTLRNWRSWAPSASVAADLAEVDGSVSVSVTTLRAASHEACLTSSVRSPPEPWTNTTAGFGSLPGGTSRKPSMRRPPLSNETSWTAIGYAGALTRPLSS